MPVRSELSLRKNTASLGNILGSNSLDFWAKASANNTNCSRKNIIIKKAFDIHKVRNKVRISEFFFFNPLEEWIVLSLLWCSESELKALMILYLELDTLVFCPSRNSIHLINCTNITVHFCLYAFHKQGIIFIPTACFVFFYIYFLYFWNIHFKSSILLRDWISQAIQKKHALHSLVSYISYAKFSFNWWCILEYLGSISVEKMADFHPSDSGEFDSSPCMTFLR